MPARLRPGDAKSTCSPLGSASILVSRTNSTESSRVVRGGRTWSFLHVECVRVGLHGAMRPTSATNQHGRRTHTTLGPSVMLRGCFSSQFLLRPHRPQHQPLELLRARFFPL